MRTFWAKHTSANLLSELLMRDCIASHMSHKRYAVNRFILHSLRFLPQERCLIATDFDMKEN